MGGNARPPTAEDAKREGPGRRQRALGAGAGCRVGRADRTHNTTYYALGKASLFRFQLVSPS